MTDAGGASTACDEQFIHTVTSENVLEGWEALQSFFERFLGGDDGAAWSLAELTHQPAQKCEPNEEGELVPTGEWELVSTGTWKRDPVAPTPVRELRIADELPELDQLGG